MPFKRVWFGIDAGYSYRTAQAATLEISEYVNKMRSGIYFGADLHISDTRNMGFGVRYTGHRYKHLKADHKVKTDYIALSLLTKRLNHTETGALVMGGSLGYLSYSEKATELNIDINKPGIGATFDFGYDFRLSKHAYFGIKLTLTAGWVDMGENGRESLAALDIGVGYRF